MERQLASLDLTHVLCKYPQPWNALQSTYLFIYPTDDADSHLSLGLALLTLSPILLTASYASLVVFTRELTILIMCAGQLLCEASNYALKHSFKQPRPNGSSHVSDGANCGANRLPFCIRGQVGWVTDTDSRRLTASGWRTLPRFSSATSDFVIASPPQATDL